MSSPAPRFTVVLPTHDRRALLREAIDSVVQQTFADWELVVVDDASSEPITEPELREWAGARARLLVLPSSQGGAAAKAAGAEVARGQLLAFLDDDDLLAPEYLAAADAALRAAPEVRVVFMGVSWFGERGASGQSAQDAGMAAIRALAAPTVGVDGVWRFERQRLVQALLERVPMPFQRPVTDVDTFRAVGNYRAECLLWDCDWALRAALQAQCALLERGLYLQRASGQGYSSKGTRALEHTRSNLEIKARLLARCRPEAAELRRMFRSALHRGWMDYSWQLAERGQTGEARDALRQASQHGWSWPLVRMWARLRLRPSERQART